MFTEHLQHVHRTLSGEAVKVYGVFVPYPAKTDRQTILSAAVEAVTREGIRDLSLRSLAASLHLAPNALYRYFSDRAALEAALTDEAARQLEDALRQAAQGCEPVAAVRRMAAAYLKFARENRNLYEVMMSPHAPEHDGTCRQSLWLFTIAQVQRLTGESRGEQAAVALWALLHGVAVLEAARVFGGHQPANGLDFGLDAWLLAVSAPAKQTGKPRPVRAKPRQGGANYHP